MCKALNFLLMFVLIVGCERSGLSPVEIKLYEVDQIERTAPPVLPSHSNNVHVVLAGESIFDIANMYDSDPMHLAKINGIHAPYNVSKGQRIKIPSSFADNTSNEAKELDIPPYEGKRDESKDTKSGFDEEFAKIMSIKGGAPDKSEEFKAEKGIGFNEQAAQLSVPKITKSAVSKKSDDPVVKKTSPTKQDTSMIYPVEGKDISKFGDLVDGVENEGINIAAPAGTDVKASAGGTVIYAGNKLAEEFGNVVVVQHEDGLISSYAHLKNISVKKGAKLNQGDIVGSVGQTGDVKTPQLHFEVMKNKKPVNPAKYVKKRK